MDFVDFTRETIVGFIGESRGDDSLHSRAACGVGKKAGVNSVAGDDPERVWNLHEASLVM
jgi:hypothetical protein